MSAREEMRKQRAGRDLRDLVKQMVDEALLEERRLGTVDPAYAAGLPKVIFDGEDTVSGRTYPHLAHYAPAAGDRVELLRFGSTWVIQGKVTS